MSYRTATICLNGHILSEYQANCQKFCSRCGSPTISYCPDCRAPIRGAYYLEDPFPFFDEVPLDYYCYNCGSPYPWTQLILDNAVELLSLDVDLDDSYKELIKTAIPDLIVETPLTPVAVAKYESGISRTGTAVSNALRQLLIDVVCESAKSALFP